MRKDLTYALNKEWFGSPKDCVPKSAIQQILDAEGTPFDDLSWHCLLFLLKCTNNCEPWMGLGFTTNVNNEIKQAAKRKANELDKEHNTDFYNKILKGFSND